MDAATLFSICNAAVVPFWLLILFAPYWRWTQRLVHTFVLPQAFAVLYVVLGIPRFFSGDGSFGSLEGVQAIFADPYALLAGWIHYLVFDLFVGAWESRDAQRLGISHWAVIPCLVLTFMLGPTGLLCYLIVRWGLRRRFVLDEGVAHAAST